MNIEQVKQRFGIIGHSEKLDRAINIAIEVAPTDLSVLISGESGSGKEAMPQIIHQLSSRKHNKYIAVNCGAIPEGTIDSELFGHEKGSFTGASENRKGYFEVADGGTIFLDEVAELPLQTQVRLLRVLESGEFLKVGSSKVQKTNTRIVAASNVKLPKAIKENKFREDLFYRLNTVPIEVPPLRDRQDDIHLLFRKFSADFADKYKMPPLRLSEEAKELLIKYRWPGNIRQLKNVTEQISVIEKSKQINAEILLNYLPQNSESSLPILYSNSKNELSEREILYKIMFELKKDVSDLKKVVFEVLNSDETVHKSEGGDKAYQRLYEEENALEQIENQLQLEQYSEENKDALSRSMENEKKRGRLAKEAHAEDEGELHEKPIFQEVEEEEESLSIADTEKKLIIKALKKHQGKRKLAAADLGISERTLYRKIKEYELEL